MDFGLMLFSMKDRFNQILVKMISDYIGPAGSIPFERLVARNLGFFQELRERGLTWEQISRLLADAGIVHRNGRPFSASHLRGVFGRQQKRAVASASVKPCDNVATAPEPPMAPARPSKPGPKQETRKKWKTADPGEGAFVSPAASIDPLSADAGSMSGGSEPHRQHGDSASDRPVTNTPHRDRAGALALMRQAALARRSV